MNAGDDGRHSAAARRAFLRAASLGAGALVLPAAARPTRATPLQGEKPPADLPAGPTRRVVAGPFYRPGAPFRGKTTPPFEPGTVMLFSGRVFGWDSRRPLGGATLDLWHVDVDGRYSSGAGDFKNRARVLTAEDGSFEVEIVHPVAYQPGPGGWRCAHLHLAAEAPGYRPLVTEVYFQGDPHQETDFLFHPSLCVPVQRHGSGAAAYETARFDVVLERASG
jgi:catechol 1,2-dioxygenase